MFNTCWTLGYMLVTCSLRVGLLKELSVGAFWIFLELSRLLKKLSVGGFWIFLEISGLLKELSALHILVCFLA